MKTVCAIIMSVVLGAAMAQASIYSDATGDARWNTKMDITQVEVTHDAANIYFNITLADGAAFWADNYAQFGLGIDSVAGGDTGANAWGSTFYMSSGMDYFSGGWTDAANANASPGVNTYNYDGASWPYLEYWGPGISGDTISFGLSRANLGLTGATDEFAFDVYTFWSSGDVEDALGSGTQITSNGYDSTANGFNTYVIPEPATIGLIGMFGVGLIAVRRTFRI